MSKDPSPCGCATFAEPIVCTLTGQEQQARRAAEFRDAFVHLERTEPLEGAFRWHFRGEPALEAHLRALARREQECCRFFDFRITREGTSIVWETRGPESAAGVLEEFMRLPETLRSEPTLDAMQRALGDAGLTFVSEAGRISLPVEPG
ncbi:hypothetical protein WME95_03725 [Sorangium sp. So ce327]|uniref:hypothetical protein n=1 Tax=Sorangium sp. So ce327 TaxID=3133301 RepID=UPI003F602931